MELTLKLLDAALEKHGVQVLDPVGEPFNPELHQAMSVQESTEVAPGTVVTVVQKGYVLNGRVLRPAMVIVAKRPAEDGGARGERLTRGLKSCGAPPFLPPDPDNHLSGD